MYLPAFQVSSNDAGGLPVAHDLLGHCLEFIRRVGLQRDRDVQLRATRELAEAVAVGVDEAEVIEQGLCTRRVVLDEGDPPGPVNACPGFVAVLGCLRAHRSGRRHSLLEVDRLLGLLSVERERERLAEFGFAEQLPVLRLVVVLVQEERPR